MLHVNDVKFKQNCWPFLRAYLTYCILGEGEERRREEDGGYDSRLNIE